MADNPVPREKFEIPQGFYASLSSLEQVNREEVTKIMGLCEDIDTSPAPLSATPRRPYTSTKGCHLTPTTWRLASSTTGLGQNIPGRR